MHRSSKLWWGLGIGLAIAVVVGLVVRTWLVPALIVRQLGSLSGGAVTIRDWWLNFRSAGVVGLTLHEARGAESPVWATADRVETDLSLGGLLLGRVSPRRINLVAPRFVLRLGLDGRWLNPPDVQEGNGNGHDSPVPAIRVEGGQVTFRREGRPEMVVHRIDARLTPEPGGGVVVGRADDPTWGRWEASGTIEPGFQRGSIRLEGRRFSADRAALERICFVPPVVWSHVVPQGPVDVAVSLRWAPAGAHPFETWTEVTLRETAAQFPSLGLATTATTGHLVIENGVVTVDEVRGAAIGGTLAARGTLDFAQQPPRIDLGLDLRQVNVVETPSSWQLGEVCTNGQLTGQVQLVALLKPEGIDLSGSSGDAVVEGATIEGIPVKSLRLVMRAERDNLQFATEQNAGAWDPSIRQPLPQPGSGPLPLHAMAWAVGQTVALLPPPRVGDVPAATKEAPRAGEPKKKRGVLLPRTITTRIELEDVDLARLVSRAQFLVGFPFPLPVQGRLGLKADATIPLGRLRDLKDYAFHGDLTLSGASLARLDIGHVAARIDLADGVLALKDFRGRLVDFPAGGPDKPPRSSVLDVPLEGPLPTGAFRGNLRAELSPLGALAARFEGNQLPLGELSAPFLPRPTPVSGRVTMSFEGRADLAHASDPRAWDISGQARSEQIAYRGAVLDRVETRFRLKDGKVDLPDFAATLNGQPLAARGELELSPPYHFDGTLSVTGWDLNTVVTLIPSAPHPAPVSGRLDARAVGKGTLSPLSVQTQGQGRLARFQAGPVPLGDVPFRWTTEGESIAIRGIEARPFGGRLTAEADVPIAPGKPTQGHAEVRGIDTALLSAALPGQSLSLTGKADGRATFTILPDASWVVATVRLDAPDLTVQGLPAEHVQADVQALRGELRYEVTADSLGGKVKLRGDFPLTAAPLPAHATLGNREINASLQAVGFTLDRLWKARGMTGMAAGLKGLGALDANLRSESAGPDAGLWLHGISEFRNLSWGPHFPLGRLRGIVVLTPNAWRIEPITGELFGGNAQGSIRGTAPSRGREPGRRLGFGLRMDHASLKNALGFQPDLARVVDGFGTLHLAGSLGDALRATAELDVPRAEIAGLPLRELRMPAELVLTPETGAGTVSVRRGVARLAGGQVHGDASFRLGEDRSFQADLQLAGLDLESIARLQSDARRPAAGRVSGRISLNGPNPADLARYRGKITLDLDDASLVYLPVFRELDRFLGSAHGGLFEDGDLAATIANRQVVVELLTLEGRVAQLHATGTVGFDTQLNLDVLLNTNQIIPQTGQALARLVPGLSDVLGRRNDQAALRFANFLSNRLTKLRVTGTIRNPTISAEPGVVVADTAVAFFAGVLKLPLGFLK